jgi:hypothetical protein
MNGGEVEFRITADSADAEKQLEEVEGKAQGIGGALKTAAQAAKEFGEGFKEGWNEATQSAETAGEAAEKAGSSTKEASKAAEDFKTRITERIADTMFDFVMKSISQVIDSTKALVTETAAAGDTIDKQSQRLGMTAEEYQEWSYILSQNGANISTLTMGMKTLTNQIDALGSGSKSAAETFAKLGLSYEQLAGLSGEQQFTAVVQKLQSMEDETQRNAVANDLLGRSYMDLIPLLNQSADSVEELRARAHETGQIIDDEAVKAAVNYTDAMDTLSRSFDGFKERIGAEILPGITEVAEGITDLINGIDGGEEKIQEGIDKAITAGEKVIPRIGTLIGTAASSAGKMAPDVIRAILNGIIDALPTIADGFVGLAKVVTDAVKDALPDIGTAGGAVVSTIMTAILDTLSKPEETAEIVGSFVLFGQGLCQGIADGIVNYDWATAAANFENGLADVLESGQKHVQVWLDNLFTGGSVYGGDINNVQTSPFIENMRKGSEEIVAGVEDYTTKARDAYLKGKAELDEVFYTTDSSKGKDALSEKEETVAEDVSAGAGALGEAAELAEDKTETLGDAMARLDRLYAKHKYTEEEYYAERKKILEQYRNEESVEWWRYYDEIEAYYEKQTEKEAQAQQKAQAALRERTEGVLRDLESEKIRHGYSDEWLADAKRKYIEDTLDHDSELYKDYDNKLLKEEQNLSDRRAKERKQALKDEEADRKKAEEERKRQTERELRDIETAAAKEGIGDEELLKRERAYIDSKLDHDSELYKDYDNKLSKRERELSEKNEKAAEKAADAQVKALEKSYEKVVQARDRLADSIAIDTGSLFKVTSTTDKRTGATDKSTSLALEEFKKQIEAKKKLPGKIAKLLDSGVPDTLITDLIKLDPRDAVKFADELLGSPAKLKELITGLQTDESISSRIAQMMTESSADFEKLGKDAGEMFGEGFFESFGTDWEKEMKGMFADGSLPGIVSANSSGAYLPLITSTAPAAAANRVFADAKSALTARAPGETTVRIVDANGKYVATVVNAENEAEAVRGGK